MNRETRCSNGNPVKAEFMLELHHSNLLGSVNTLNTMTGFPNNMIDGLRAFFWIFGVQTQLDNLTYVVQLNTTKNICLRSTAIVDGMSN